MHKNVLKADASFDFRLLGISTSLADFQLAWHINEQLNINLRRATDHKIHFQDSRYLRTSNFEYATEHLRLKLVKNKVEEGEGVAFVIPEARNMDFFLLVQDEAKDLEIVNVKSTLSEIKNVILVQEMDVQRLKSLDNLIVI